MVVGVVWWVDDGWLMWGRFAKDEIWMVGCAGWDGFALE